MQAYFYVIGRNGFSMNFSTSWFKRMITAYAHGAGDCPGYPGQSAQSDAMLEGQRDGQCTHCSSGPQTILQVVNLLTCMDL